MTHRCIDSQHTWVIIENQPRLTRLAIYDDIPPVPFNRKLENRCDAGVAMAVAVATVMGGSTENS